MWLYPTDQLVAAYLHLWIWFPSGSLLDGLHIIYYLRFVYVSWPSVLGLRLGPGPFFCCCFLRSDDMQIWLRDLPVSRFGVCLCDGQLANLFRAIQLALPF